MSLTGNDNYCQPSNVESYPGSGMSAGMTYCRKPYYMEQGKVVVTEEDRKVTEGQHRG